MKVEKKARHNGPTVKHVNVDGKIVFESYKKRPCELCEMLVGEKRPGIGEIMSVTYTIDNWRVFYCTNKNCDNWGAGFVNGRK